MARWHRYQIGEYAYHANFFRIFSHLSQFDINILQVLFYIVPAGLIFSAFSLFFWLNRVYQWSYAFFLLFILFFIIFHVSWSDACDLPYVGYLRFDWLQVPPMVSANLFHEVTNRKAKTWSEPFVTIGTPTFLSKTKKMRITRDIRDRKKRKCSENKSSDLYIIWITTGKYGVYKSQMDFMEIYA